jgi:DNA-nicking Smr family endonuclease
MARRRRDLSPDDRRVWDEVARTATPLRPKPVAEAPPPVSGVVAPSKAAPPVRQVAPAAPRITYDLAPDPQTALERANPHMDRRRFDKLRRGRLEPEARIDLHGMTAERAHAALSGFILRAYAEDLRLVLVITGKGRPGDTDRLAPYRSGVLRHGVPHWLAAPPLGAKVLQVAPAHSRHGGGGAYYVYLRRPR